MYWGLRLGFLISSKVPTSDYEFNPFLLPGLAVERQYSVNLGDGGPEVLLYSILGEVIGSLRLWRALGLILVLRYIGFMANFRRSDIGGSILIK